MRTTHAKGVTTPLHAPHHLHAARATNAHGGAAAGPRSGTIRRHLAALHAGMRAALRALRATNPKP